MLRLLGHKRIAVLWLCLFTTSAARAQFIWGNPLGGAFSQSTNWIPFGPPSEATDVATFSINSSYGVTFDATSAHGGLVVSGGSVEFASGAPTTYSVSSLSIAGGTTRVSGALTLRTLSQASINGRLIVSGPGAVYSALEPIAFWGAGTDAATLEFSNGAAVNIKSAALGVGSFSRGRIDLLSGATLTVAGGLTIGNEGAATMTIQNATLDAFGFEVGTGGFVHFVSGALRATNALSLRNGGQLILSPGGDKVIRAASLNVNDTARLDLADNLLIVTYAENNLTNDIRRFLRSAYNGGLWTGGGITRSVAAANPALALALFDNASMGLTSFRGQPLTDHDIVVTPALSGDANLDGRIDVTDLAAVATNWQRSASWSGGDFTYDGVVDISDLAKLATYWQTGVNDNAKPPTPLADFSQALASVGLGGIAVPEPGMLGLLLAQVVGLRRRSFR